VANVTAMNYYTTYAYRSNLFFKDDIKQDCEIQMNTMMKWIVLIIH